MVLAKLNTLQVFGKLVKVQHCPRNGKSESHSNATGKLGRRMAATLASPETGLKSAAMHCIVILHIAEGNAAKLLSAVFGCPMVLSVPSVCLRGCAFTKENLHVKTHRFIVIILNCIFRAGQSGVRRCGCPDAGQRPGDRQPPAHGR